MSNFEDKEARTNGRWTKSEHEKFLLGLELYGKNWKKIQELIGTRTGSQIRSHAQKFFLKVKKTGDVQQNSQGVHDTNDCGQPLTVISKAASEPFEAASDNSFFMEKIIKASASNHFNLDFWSYFIDVKSEKPEAQQSLIQPRRKDSFVGFENLTETKNDTPINYLNPLGEQIA